MRSRHIVLGRLGFALSFEATGGETASVRRLFVQLRSPRAGGSADQVVALGDVRGPAGGLGVRHGGGREIAAELVQVAADGVPAVPLAEHLAQPVGLAQSGGGAKHVADRHRAPEHGGWVVAHRVVGEGDEVVIPGKDLRPVGLLGDCRVVVQGGDRGLDLVARGAVPPSACSAPTAGRARPRRSRGCPTGRGPVDRADDATLWVESRREAGVVQEHQREQPAHFRLIGGEG